MNMTGKRIKAEHGVIWRLPGERFGYFGWPTVARLDNGTLVVASSGLRAEHVCPFGKTVLNVSADDGRTWSPPRVIQDSLIDDRDAGLCAWGDRNLLVTWFRDNGEAPRFPRLAAASAAAFFRRADPDLWLPPGALWPARRCQP